MGVKLSSIAGADEYRQKLYQIGELLVYRLMRPWMHMDFICKITGYRNALNKLLKPVHAFTANIINQRREQFNQIADHIEDLTEENM